MGAGALAANYMGDYMSDAAQTAGDNYNINATSEADGEELTLTPEELARSAKLNSEIGAGAPVQNVNATNVGVPTQNVNATANADANLRKVLSSPAVSPYLTTHAGSPGKFLYWNNALKR